MRYNKEEQRLEQVENDTEVDEVPSDKRTFEIVREVGDSVDPMIQLTVDYPSNHPNNRVPILDLEVWIERRQEGYQQVMWRFYEKPMKNKCVMMRSSSVPEQTKRSLVN